MTKVQMPLVEAMLAYKQAGVYPLHTPGHKGGRGLAAELGELFPATALELDVSLMSELDDLHQPTGCLAKAQQLAAELYGAERSFFAVNGTTEAIHAMLLCALQPGDKVLVPRNAHRSVAGGLILGDLQAVFLAPEYDDTFGINTQVTPTAVVAALTKDPQIKALLVTSPNYYGMAADLAQLAHIAQQYGVLLLVDEAHGAHLGFSKLLPPSALACGADACAQSTHKLLGAWTQCSMLHVRGPRIDLERAAQTMSLLTSTSPNYLLMASLDAARGQMAANGEKLVQGALSAAQALRQRLESFDGLRVLDASCVGRNGVFALDLTKVTVNVAAWGLTGIFVGAFLRQRGVAVELVDRTNVLFLVTYADASREFEQIVQQVAAAFTELEQLKTAPLTVVEPDTLPLSTTVLGLRQAFYAPVTTLAFATSEGRVAAEQVSFYPPGIPVLLPGELITWEIINYCQKMLALGLPVSGPRDSTLAQIRVVKA